MNQDPVRISQIHWTKVFPFLRLFEASSLGCGLTVLLLGYVGLVVSWTGSGLLNRVFSGGRQYPTRYRACGIVADDECSAIDTRQSFCLGHSSVF